MRTTSSVSPELEMAITTSPRMIMPRSPWIPSAGCRKKAGVPVDAMVEAIFWPISPDFPMPVTTTRPLAPRIICTARSNAPLIEASRFSSASASTRITLFASANIKMNS